MTARARLALKLGAVALPLLLLAAFGWALRSNSGLHFVLARADAVLRGGLSVGRVEGSLATGFVLEDVRVVLGDTRITLRRVQGELRSAPLLVGKLTLVLLELDGVRAVVPADPNPTPFVLPPRIELPLHLALERFAARDVELMIGATPPLRFDAVTGRASADRRGLLIEDARFEAEGLSADGSLALALAQPYATAGALRLKLERPDQPPIAGNAQLSGRLEALRLAVGLDAPLAAQADLALDDPFGAKRISGSIRAKDADLAPLIAASARPQGRATLEGWRFDGDLALAGTLAEPALAGTLAARHADLPELRARFDARLAGQAVQLERLTLTAAGMPTRVEARGRVTLDGRELPFAIDVRATDLALPGARQVLVPAATVTLAGDLTAARGSVTASDGLTGTLAAELEVAVRSARAVLNGTIAGWALPGGAKFDAERLSATLAGGRVAFDAAGSASRGRQQLRYALAGDADEARLAVARIELGLLGGQVVGNGELGFGRTPRVQATLRARGLDPRGLDPRFPGNLAGQLDLRGSPATLELELSGLSGELRGRKVVGSARLRRGVAPEMTRLGLAGLTLDALELKLGTAELSARSQPASAAFALSAADLADLLPNARGQLEVRAARGAAGGSSARLSGRGVVLGTGRVATLDARLEAPASGRVDGELAAADLSVGDIALDTLRLEADGDRSALALGLDATRSGTRFIAKAGGALQPRGFVGQLTRWELAPVGAATWTLAQAAALTVGRDGATLGLACVSDGEARACVDGGWHPLDPWRAAIKVEHLGIGAFHAWLPRGLAYAGEIDLAARVAGVGPTLGDVRAELTLSSGNIEATVRRGQQATTTRLIEFSGGRVLLEREAQHLGLRAALTLGSGGILDLALDARGAGPLASRPLTGRIVARAEQFALLPALLPEVKQLSGKLEADLTVSGQVDSPRFAGHAAFHAGTLSVPRLGLDISEFELEVTGDGDALDLQGSARAGGRLEWQAKLRHAAGGWAADGTLKGERVRALRTPEARVIASPDLKLAYADGRVSVTGTLVVPEARIAPRSLASAVQSSSDEVLVGESADAAAGAALTLDARVHVALGSDVEFEGFGLKAGVEGGLTLIEKPGSLTLASGELALVDGKYEAYGQQLAIARGKLLFSGGPVADPGLDVRAQRVIDRSDSNDVTVGIDVRGTLRRPELTLFSNPAMSSSEQLSYLVLGRALNESTAGDQQRLGDAAQSMKLSGGELIAQQIGQRIGLDEVRIEDDGDQAEAQLWLGTYLSPRLFVSYGIGLFEDFYSARVRYDISTRWTVEAESGRDSSADFKYTIER